MKYRWNKIEKRRTNFLWTTTNVKFSCLFNSFSSCKIYLGMKIFLISLCVLLWESIWCSNHDVWELHSPMLIIHALSWLASFFNPCMVISFCRMAQSTWWRRLPRATVSTVSSPYWMFSRYDVYKFPLLPSLLYPTPYDMFKATKTTQHVWFIAKSFVPYIVMTMIR